MHEMAAKNSNNFLAAVMIERVRQGAIRKVETHSAQTNLLKAFHYTQVRAYPHAV